MIPDTGSDGIVIFAGRGRSLPAMTPLNVGLLRTLTGQRLVRRVVLDALQVGSVRLEQQVGVMMPEGRTTLPFADGLLPLHLFSRVTINGPAGYIAVEK